MSHLKFEVVNGLCILKKLTFKPAFVDSRVHISICFFLLSLEDKTFKLLSHIQKVLIQWVFSSCSTVRIYSFYTHFIVFSYEYKFVCQISVASKPLVTITIGPQYLYYFTPFNLKHQLN